MYKALEDLMQDVIVKREEAAAEKAEKTKAKAVAKKHAFRRVGYFSCKQSHQLTSGRNQEAGLGKKSKST